MPRVERTEKPCPVCADKLDLFLEHAKIDPADLARTARVIRILKCPSCDFTRDDSPPPRIDSSAR